MARGTRNDVTATTALHWMRSRSEFFKFKPRFYATDANNLPIIFGGVFGGVFPAGRGRGGSSLGNAGNGGRWRQMFERARVFRRVTSPSDVLMLTGGKLGERCVGYGQRLMAVNAAAIDDHRVHLEPQFNR